MNANKKQRKFIDFLYQYGIILTILLMSILFTGVTQGRFLQGENIINILRSMSIVTIISIGVTFSLVVGGFDLSVGSIASTSMVVVMAMFVWYEQGLVVSIIVALLAAVVIGLLNAFMTIKFKIPDMLTTLASMFIFNGVSTTMSKGKIISEHMTMDNGMTSKGLVPASFRAMGSVPWIIVIMVVIVILVYVFLTFTKYGRYMYIVGGNQEAARLSGIPVNRYKLIAYMLSALFAGIGGLILAARIGQANPSAGSGYLMESVAAAYIGYSFWGVGKPNAIGTFFGALLMVALSNGLVMISVPYYSMDIIKGLVLVLALALTYYNQNRR